jgi:hypothetical protein
VESGDRRAPEAARQASGAVIPAEVKLVFGALLLLLIGAFISLSILTARLPAGTPISP